MDNLADESTALPAPASLETALPSDESRGAPGSTSRDVKTGQFLPGKSGNPVGRPVGSRNRANLVREFIEEKLVNRLEKDAVKILKVAIAKAKKGDPKMIKLLLGDLLAPARNGTQAAEAGGKKISITINNMTQKEPARVGITIDQDPDEDPPSE